MTKTLSELLGALGDEIAKEVSFGGVTRAFQWD